MQEKKRANTPLLLQTMVYFPVQSDFLIHLVFKGK